MEQWYDLERETNLYLKHNILPGQAVEDLSAKMMNYTLMLRYFLGLFLHLFKSSFTMQAVITII